MTRELRNMIMVDAALVVLALGTALHFTECGVEYWIERYQASIGAAVTLGSAWYAGRLVLRQIDIAREQNAIAQGLGDPSLWMTTSPPWYRGQQPFITLHVDNWSRYTIRIDTITCTKPLLFASMVGVLEMTENPTNEVAGTNPRASTVERSHYRVWLDGHEFARKVEDFGFADLFEPTFRIDYTVFGPDPTVRTTQVRAPASTLSVI